MRQFLVRAAPPLAASAAVLLVALPILTYPLGRDQGEFATIARGLLDGRIPYVELWNPKPPAIFGVYALAIALLGPTSAAIRVLDLLWFPLMAGALAWIGGMVGRTYPPTPLSISEGEEVGAHPRVRPSTSSARSVILRAATHAPVRPSNPTAIWSILVFGAFYFSETFWTLTQNDGMALLPMTLAVACALQAARCRSLRGSLAWSLLAGMLCAVAIGFKYPFALIAGVCLLALWSAPGRASNRAGSAGAHIGAPLQADDPHRLRAERAAHEPPLQNRAVVGAVGEPPLQNRAVVGAVREPPADSPAAKVFSVVKSASASIFIAFGLGTALILAVGAAWMVAIGAWDALVESAVVTSGYTAQSFIPEDFAEAMHTALAFRFAHWGLLFLLALIGAVRWPRRCGWRPALVLYAWAAAGLAIMLVQGKGYDYHWLPLLPPLALLAGGALGWVGGAHDSMSPSSSGRTTSTTRFWRRGLKGLSEYKRWPHPPPPSPFHGEGENTRRLSPLSIAWRGDLGVRTVQKGIFGQALNPPATSRNSAPFRGRWRALQAERDSGPSGLNPQQVVAHNRSVLSVAAGFSLRRQLLLALLLLAVPALNIWPRFWPYLTGAQDHYAYAEQFQAGEFIARESLEMADFLRARVTPGDSLFIWGFRPEIYYLSQLKPAVRFIFQFPLVADWYPLAWRDQTVEILWAALPPYVLVLQVDYMPWVTGSDEDSHTLLQDFDEMNNWLVYNYERYAQIGNFIIWQRK